MAEEALLGFYQVAEWYSLTNALLTDYEEGEAARRTGFRVFRGCFCNVVDEMLVMGEGELAGLVVFDFWEDYGSEGGGV